MITGRQIRAARALLEWDAEDLAEKAELSRDTIFNIENGKVQARGTSAEKIVQAFDRNGIEFTDDSGVRLKRHGVDVLIGKIGLQQFFDNVYEHMRKHGGTIVQLGVDEGQFEEIVGTEFATRYKKRMGELVEERKDIKVQAILREGDTNLMYSNYNEYRWISNDIFAPVPFYIYGETLAIMDFQTVPAPTIIVHKFPAITQAYRKQFEVFWKISKIPVLSEKLTASLHTKKEKT
jgi:DNA-binding XRE family transcriptional regulator